MNCASYPTLWAELHLRFFDRFDSARFVHRQRHPNLKAGDHIPRYHQVAFADECHCESATIYSPDWSIKTVHEANRYPNPWRFTRSKHGHNWFGVTRIDFYFFPLDVPFYYWGRCYTGGLAGQTIQLRRMENIHQCTHIGIPAKAILTPIGIGQGITHAAWTFRRKAHEAFLTRTINDGWVAAPSYDIAIQRKVLSSLQLPYIPAA